MIGAAIISTQGFVRAGQAAKVEKLASGASGLGELVQRIHQERTLALTVISGQANGNKVNEFKRAQAATDEAITANRAFIGSLDLSSLSTQAVEAVSASEEAHNKLGTVRADIAAGHAQSDQVAARYDSMIALDVALPQRIGDSLTDRPIGRSLAAYSALANLVELASQEAELGAQVVAQKGVDPATAVQLSSLQGVQNQAIQTFRLNATDAQSEALDAALYQPIDQRAAFTSERLDIVASVQGTPIATKQGEWIKNSAARVTAIRAQLEPLAASTAKNAAASAADARRQAVLLLGLGLAVVAVLVGLGLVLARAMTRPLRRLTVTAGEVAEELPRMVERMATPGEGPGIQLPEIEVGSNDEVGQLALAFKNVNDTTVRVAEEQAALRASIAEMFVNVARRNHVLLSRQLSFIDQLERTEENPDTLDNLFRLDHLATRMRRNAESLIVLAGIDAGRRLRRPMPLSDVIRTAVSEIERYDRVDLALQADPPLVGHVALTTAHMIAELLENATQFSNPDTRVVTATAFSNSGVRITITDLGLGMTWDEITDANARIANPPVTDVVGSQRLGFYVVGRLARRLDATVALRPGRTQGTVVTIDLPPALFVPGSVTELPTVEVDAAPVERDAVPTAREGGPVLPQAPVVPQLPEVPAAEVAAEVPAEAPVVEAPVEAPAAEAGSSSLPR
ncbi:sensor histidine kinase, partial [Angustibacter peucedani]